MQCIYTGTPAYAMGSWFCIVSYRFNVHLPSHLRCLSLPFIIPNNADFKSHYSHLLPFRTASPASLFAIIRRLRPTEFRRRAVHFLFTVARNSGEQLICRCGLFSDAQITLAASSIPSAADAAGAAILARRQQLVDVIYSVRRRSVTRFVSLAIATDRPTRRSAVPYSFIYRDHTG